MYLGKNGKAKHQGEKILSQSLTPQAGENNLRGMRTCSPFFCLLAGSLSFLLWGGLQGCSNDADNNKEDGNTTSQTDDNYPLKVCVVSGEELGSMGKPHVHDHNGTIVKFCCEPCLKDFNEDPDKYLAKLKP